MLDIQPEDLAQLEDVERDAHGNVRIAEVNIGEILKAQVQARLKQFGIKTTIVAKNIGYELRCADPIPFDMEYTRDLGYCAAKYLLSGGNAAMVSMQGGHFVPIPFKDLLDPKTGKAKIRLVDTHSTRYAIARRYMIRLRRDDFEDPHELAKFAATCGDQPAGVPQRVRVPDPGRAAPARPRRRCGARQARERRPQRLSRPPDARRPAAREGWRAFAVPVSFRPPRRPRGPRERARRGSGPASLARRLRPPRG